MKQVKRIITSNISPSGSLNVDSFHKGILSYRNTIDPVTKFSPALAVFGRQVRDGLPVLPGKYNPHNTWKELLEHREKAMAQRHVAQHEAWSEHTKKLPSLPVGTKVFIQNQVGNNPRRWERTGKVVEVKDHDQYNVRVDGTGRVTLRNRKFLRSFTPITRTPPTGTSQPIKTSPPLEPATTEGAGREWCPSNPPLHPQPIPAQPLPVQPIPVQLPPPMQQHEEPVSVQEACPPRSPPAPAASSPGPHSTPVPSSPVPAPAAGSPGPHRTPAPGSPAPAQRPQRIRKPNSMLSSDIWDLSSLVEDSPTLSSKQVAELFRFLASKVENADISLRHPESQTCPEGGR